MLRALIDVPVQETQVPSAHSVEIGSPLIISLGISELV